MASTAVEARRAEVRAHLEATYFSRISLVETKLGPQGEVVDWVDPRSLDPNFDATAVPREFDATVSAANDSPKDSVVAEPPPIANPGQDLKAAWSDVAVRGPRGTVPLIRPNFDQYIEGRSRDQDLETFVRSRSAPPAIDPNNPRLYTGKTRAFPNLGGFAWVNYVNPTGVSSTEFSLIQQGTFEGSGNSLETVEFGIQESQIHYGDDKLHMFAYYTTNGYTSHGDYQGGYNNDVTGFVPASGAFPLGAIVPNPSTASGHERLLQTWLTGGNWWLRDCVGSVSSSTCTWLGYYPASLFNLLADGASHQRWQSEVFDPSPSAWTNANSGNGVFGATSGSLYIREPMLTTSTANIALGGTNMTANVDTGCYSNSGNFTSSAAGWSQWFRYGGPGGNAPGGTCNPGF